MVVKMRCARAHSSSVWGSVVDGEIFECAPGYVAQLESAGLAARGAIAPAPDAVAPDAPAPDAPAPDAVAPDAVAPDAVAAVAGLIKAAASPLARKGRKRRR